MKSWIFIALLTGLLGACQSTPSTSDEGSSAADSSQATVAEPVLITVAAGGIT